MLEQPSMRSECEATMQDSGEGVEKNSVHEGERSIEKVVTDWALEMEEEEVRTTPLSVAAHSTDSHPLNSTAASAVSKEFSYASALTGIPKARKGNSDNTYLPPNHDWTKYVLLNCTTHSRPIYTVDVLEAIARKMDTRKVVSIGAFRSANVFLLELNSVQAKQQLLQQQNITVAGAEVIVTSAKENHITVTIVNLPHAITQTEVSQALSRWGVVLQQFHLYSPDQRFNHIIINRRKVTVKLHPEVTVDEFPQSLVVASFRVPCFVAGRPPKCYSCGGVGHLHQACPALDLAPLKLSVNNAVDTLNNDSCRKGETTVVEEKITDTHDKCESGGIGEEVLEQDPIKNPTVATIQDNIGKELSMEAQKNDRQTIGNDPKSVVVSFDSGEETEEEMQITTTQPKRRNEESDTKISEVDTNQTAAMVSNNCEHIDDDASPKKKKQKKQRNKQKKESKSTDEARSPIILRKSQNSGPSVPTVVTNVSINALVNARECSSGSAEDDSDNA